MQQPALEVYRHSGGPLVKKFGSTTIWTLRKTLGDNFAPGEDENANLCDILTRLDESSLKKLIEELTPSEMSEFGRSK